MELELREYQKEALDALYVYFQNNSGNPLIELPTASGKGVIQAAFIQSVMRWPGQRVLMLTHVKELVEQNVEKLLKSWPEADVGIFSAGMGQRDTGHSILFATIQSVYTRAFELGHFDLVIVDECHLIPNKSNTMYRQFLDEAQTINPYIKVIGMTATPFRTGEGHLTEDENAIFTDTAYRLPVERLVNEGYLVPVRAKGGNRTIDTSNVRTRAGEFVEKDLYEAATANELVDEAADEIIEQGHQRRSWLIFCVNIKHAEEAKNALRNKGIEADILTGKTPKKERERVIQEFKAGRIRALTNVGVLTTGFDSPVTDLIAFLRPTQSPGLYAQMIGRGMRLSPETGKEDCLILDFANNVRRHGPIDSVEPCRKKETDGDGVEPAKQCPECNELVNAAVRECPNCGYEWPPPEPKHENFADDEPVMSQTEPTRKPVMEVHYSKHEKPGKPFSLRVDYQISFAERYSEWICLEHEGYPARKAAAWWVNRTPAQQAVPKTIDEALAYIDAYGLAEPSHILVRKSGKFWEVVRHEFGSEPTDQAS